MEISSDEVEMWLTQNKMSQESLLPDFDSIQDILGIEPTEIVDKEPNISTSVSVPQVVEKPIGEQSVSSRNITLVTDKELEERKQNRIPENTKINTAWAVGAWKEWAEERNIKAKEVSSTEKLVNVDLLKNSNDELEYWLAKFVVEVRKKDDDGKCYPPSTLYQLCCGLLRYLRNNGRPALNIFESPSFKHFQDSLDSEMKRLTGLGVGADIKEAKPLTEEEENKIWGLNLLGDLSPKVLSKTMVFLIGKNFALRSGKEHRNLKFSQFTLEPASEKEPEKLVYVSFGEKNNMGGLRHRRVKRKRVEHYANEDCPERCLVRLYKFYVSKCPNEAIKRDVFYVAPRRKYGESDKVWFTSNPVGYNTLGDTVKSLCKDAGIKGHFTNHSLRATTATRGLVKGIPDKLIMERTGHRDIRSLQRYQRPSIEQKIEISKAFESNVSLKRQHKPNEEDSEPDHGVVKKCKSDSSGGIETNGRNISFFNCTLNISKDFNVV